MFREAAGPISENYGYYFGGPNNKYYNILGSILGSPNYGKLPYSLEKSARKGGKDGLSSHFVMRMPVSREHNKPICILFGRLWQ